MPGMIPEWIPLISYYSGIDTGIFHNPWNFAKPVFKGGYCVRKNSFGGGNRGQKGFFMVVERRNDKGSVKVIFGD
jgi:hypothetical protein